MLEFTYHPLTTPNFIIPFRMLLDFNISQMPTQVHNVVSVVWLMCESGKPLSVQPHCQLTIIRAENVNTQVELFSTE